MGASDALIHSQSGCKPRIFPITGLGTPDQIDRAQSLDPKVSLNREKVEELGRELPVGYLKGVPTVGCSLAQKEYGSIEFFNKLANAADSALSVTLNDFSTSYFDIAAYLDDDDGTFRGTLYYPNQRLTGFSISIGSPTAMIERSFDFTGEDAKILQGVNKYLIYKAATVASGEAGTYAMTLSDPFPVVDPNVASKYIFRVIRVKAGVSTELVETTNWTYSNATHILSILSATVADYYKVWYSAGAYPAGADPFVANDVDVAGLLANAASLYIGTTNYLYKVQSATVDVKFDREDIREIGNENVVVRGIKNKTVTITLGRILDKWTIEEVLAGKTVDYGILDVKLFSTDLTFLAKVYSDSAKGTFKIGLKATKMCPTDITPGSASIDNYLSSGDTLTGEDLLISTTEGDIA